LQDPRPNETLISSLRPDKMSEGSCVLLLQEFGAKKLESICWHCAKDGFCFGCNLHPGD
jgi:hypothetical protein